MVFGQDRRNGQESSVMIGCAGVGGGKLTGRHFYTAAMGDSYEIVRLCWLKREKRWESEINMRRG